MLVQRRRGPRVALRKACCEELGEREWGEEGEGEVGEEWPEQPSEHAASYVRGSVHVQR